MAKTDASRQGRPAHAAQSVARRRFVGILAATLLAPLAGLPVSSVAQGAWPAKPIRLIVPFPPGAGTDAIARFIAQKLGEAMNASIVVDNRTGAGGAIGAAEAARAEPDGYTLLFVASPFTTVAASSKNPGYDPLTQFAPVVPIAAGPLAFVVGESVPASTMREFIELAKANPGKYNYGSAGNGSINHLALELLKDRTGVDIVHVPYRGIADATKDLLAGQIHAMTASIPAVIPYAGDRRLKVLAVTGPARIALLPDVPSWREAGVEAADVVNYWGIVAPAGTPRDLIARLNGETRNVLAQPDVKARLAREGAELIPGSALDLAALIERDYRGWKKLITDARLRLE
jgi:tripartite-type tricarboxylate transporter receptor subunit TctC